MSTRLEKVNSLLAKRFAELLRTEVEFDPGTLVTVTRAETSVDLRYTTIYISVLPALKGPSTLERARRFVPHLQHVLHRGLSLRRRPQLRLALDKGEQHATRIEQVLAKEKRFGPRYFGRTNKTNQTDQVNPSDDTESQTRT